MSAYGRKSVFDGVGQLVWRIPQIRALPQEKGLAGNRRDSPISLMVGRLEMGSSFLLCNPWRELTRFQTLGTSWQAMVQIGCLLMALSTAWKFCNVTLFSPFPNFSPASCTYNVIWSSCLIIHWTKQVQLNSNFCVFSISKSPYICLYLYSFFFLSCPLIYICRPATFPGRDQYLPIASSTLTW